MANPTTNLNITLPVPGAEASRGKWGETVNDAFQSLDTGIAERGVPAGGTDDQILTKNGTDDYATEWATRLSSVGVVGTDGIEVDSGSPVTTSGNITLGVNKSTMLTFLNVEDGASGNMTGAEIKTAYEAETNAFTDAQFTKLAGIETSATADQTGAQIKTLYEAESNAFTDAQFTKLAGIETSATADQTGAEIKSAYEGESDTNAYTDAEKTKLAGVEASADVTDTTNVTSAGALMDSECAGLAALKLTTGTFLTADQTKLDGIEASADVTDATNVNSAGALMHTDIPDSDTGFVKRTGSETYDIDASTFLTANQTITASGDATGSGTTSLALTLAASGVSAGSYGSSSAIPVITFDAKGRATSASTASFTAASLDDVTALSLALG